ncbi:MAG: peptidoglycan recognition protein [Ilumatobacteraceae bacterium]
MHYTGSNGYNNPTQDLAYAKSVARYGKAAGKTWEYNYLIGLGGNVYEQAGGFMAAHCLNFNKQSYGVLFMNGIGVEPTDAQVEAFQWLVNTLHAFGSLAVDAEIVPHYHYRSTACPGLTLADKPGKAIRTVTGEGRDGKVNAYLLAA